MAVSKVILNGTTLMDVTQKTVTSATMLDGYTALKNDGTSITGEYVAPSFSTQSKSETYTPTTSQQTATITPDNGYDGLSSVNVTVNAMPIGSATTPYTEIEPEMDIQVDIRNGLIMAFAHGRGSITPSVVAGYVSAGTAGDYEVAGDCDYQLSTQAATTITPTTSSQTAVSAGKYTTGAITVNPIPSQYIVPSGTININNNGTVDVTQYASADVSIPATSTSYLGTNPVKIADYATQTVALSSTSFATWTPSTTYTTIYASSDVGTAVLDLVNYNYNIVWFFDIEYKYDGTESSVSKALRTCQCMQHSIYKNPTNLTNLQSQNFNGNHCTNLVTAGLIDYYDTSSVKKLTYTVSTAAYLNPSYATFSNSTSNTPTITVKSPSIRFVCNNTYLSTSNCAKIDKANTKFTLRGELWRVDKDSVLQGMYRNIVELYNS